MEPNPLVSIIIPLYNTERYISHTIESALNQTWGNKEIIVIDDGSTDNSLSIAKQYTNKGVKVFSRPNKGASAARNYGLAEANGDYIQFLDADDLLSANKLTEQVNLLLQHPGKIAVCSTIHFKSNQDLHQLSPTAYEDSFLYDTDNPAQFLTNLYGGKNNRGSMIQTNAWLSPASVIKKAGDWSEFYSPDDDGEFFCRVVLAGKGIVYAKNCFNYYRKFTHNNNLAGIKTSKALYGKFQSFLLKKQYLLNAANNPTAKKALAYCAMELAVESYPFDKKLSAEILNMIAELGGTDYVPTLGGREIELVKKIFGWKVALNFRMLYFKLTGERK
ncbi:MAG: glycosyltransferase [Bacteroidota bacterium]